MGYFSRAQLASSKKPITRSVKRACGVACKKSRFNSYIAPLDARGVRTLCSGSPSSFCHGLRHGKWNTGSIGAMEHCERVERKASPEIEVYLDWIWWPADRSWFVVCDIDATSTYIGGSDKLMQRILNDISLEAFDAQLNDPYEGYYVAPASTAAVNPRIGFSTRLRHNSLFFRFRFGRRQRGGAIYQVRKNRFWK